VISKRSRSPAARCDHIDEPVANCSPTPPKTSARHDESTHKSWVRVKHRSGIETGLVTLGSETVCTSPQHSKSPGHRHLHAKSSCDKERICSTSSASLSLLRDALGSGHGGYVARQQTLSVPSHVRFSSHSIRPELADVSVRPLAWLDDKSRLCGVRRGSLPLSSNEQVLYWSRRSRSLYVVLHD
jgi:hypothetical protein